MAHELFKFVEQVTHDMASEYQRIQERAREDPGTAGDEGEENWASLFREWLPPTYPVRTKGRILSSEGEASDQLDVMVLSPAYPRKLLDKKMYLGSGVVAAFEAKITLKAAHVKRAVETAARLRRLLPPRWGTPYRELHSPMMFGLLAHSHSWKAAESRPEDSIERALIEADAEFVRHPRELLDVVCVSDLATWASTRTTFFGPAMFQPWDTMSPQHGESGSASTAYMRQTANERQPNPAPVGVLIAKLLTRFAWEDASVRPLADYFRLAGLFGAAEGRPVQWSSHIYSEVVRSRVESGQLTNGEAWDEWSVAFI